MVIYIYRRWMNWFRSIMGYVTSRSTIWDTNLGMIKRSQVLNHNFKINAHPSPILSEVAGRNPNAH